MTINYQTHYARFEGELGNDRTMCGKQIYAPRHGMIPLPTVERDQEASCKTCKMVLKVKNRAKETTP